jgi:hypothetical protein
VCGCGEVVSPRTHSGTEFDHEPALILRDVNPAGTDYTPPQLSAEHIDARCKESHRRKTSGSGTTAGTDIGKRKKERKRAKALAALKVSPEAFEATKQRIRSRGFPPKGSRPMRRKS